MKLVTFVSTTILTVLSMSGNPWPNLADALSSGASQKSRVGVVSVTGMPTNRTVDELFASASIVAEVVRVGEGTAFEADPHAPPSQKRAVTPVTLELKRLYRNTTKHSVTEGTNLVALTPHGRVETDAYIVDTGGDSDFLNQRLYLVFLDCTTTLARCNITGPILEMRSDGTLDGPAASVELLSIGVTNLRLKLEELQSRR
jgi:hypothetical protein